MASHVPARHTPRPLPLLPTDPQPDEPPPPPPPPRRSRTPDLAATMILGVVSVAILAWLWSQAGCTSAASTAQAAWGNHQLVVTGSTAHSIAASTFGMAVGSDNATVDVALLRTGDGVPVTLFARQLDVHGCLGLEIVLANGRVKLERVGPARVRALWPALQCDPMADDGRYMDGDGKPMDLVLYDGVAQ